MISRVCGCFLQIALFSGIASFAQTLEDSLQRIIEKESSPIEVRAESFLELGEIYSGKDLNQSNGYYRKAIALNANQSIQPKQLGIAYAKLSVNFTRMAKHDSANLYINLAHKLYRKNLNEEDFAVVYLLCVSTKLKLENKLVESIQPALEAAQFQGNKHQRKWAGHALLTLGSSFSMIGDYSNALFYDKQSLELFEQEADLLGASYALFQIAVQLHQEKELVEAEKYYRQAITTQKNLQSIKGLANSYGYLASLYRQSGRTQQSLTKIDSALLLSSTLGQTGLHISNLESKAMTLMELGRMNEANIILAEALHLANKLQNDSQTAFIKTSIAYWHDKSGNALKSISVIEDALNLAQKSKSLDTKVRTYEIASRIYKRAKRFEEAFKYEQKLNHLQDSARGARSVERLKMFDVQQQLNQKQKEVTALSANQKIQQAELKQQRTIQLGIVFILIFVIGAAGLFINRQKALATTKRNLEIEKVRNRIARDLHDDLGSSLSSIKILSQVGTGGNQAQTSLEKIHERSGVLLDSLSDMVWNINTANDSIEQMISRMREFAAEMLEGNGIQYDFNTQIQREATLTIEQRKNIYLMFKEVIHNIVKHSQAQSVKISIEFDHELRITMQDDGVGILTENKSGNGLNNLKKRASEISGHVKILSPSNKGTCVEFTVPIT